MDNGLIFETAREGGLTRFLLNVIKGRVHEKPRREYVAFLFAAINIAEIVYPIQKKSVTIQPFLVLPCCLGGGLAGGLNRSMGELIESLFAAVIQVFLRPPL
ncbi:MAG: hypothetical protein LBG27_05575 [Spirochaetaceae bacterium]|jgi:hypothetical protein|nr:hypothetical protein [Spirochaetaceae bacterium]